MRKQCNKFKWNNKPFQWNQAVLFLVFSTSRIANTWKSLLNIECHDHFVYISNWKARWEKKQQRWTRMHIENIEFDSRAAKSQQRQHPIRYFIHRIKSLSRFRFSVRFPFKSFSFQNKLSLHSNKMANWKWNTKNAKKGRKRKQTGSNKETGVIRNIKKIFEFLWSLAYL